MQASSLKEPFFFVFQVALIDPLKDLAAHESDTSFLSPEYQHILQNSEELQQQYKRQPAQLERLYGRGTTNKYYYIT